MKLEYKKPTVLDYINVAIYEAARPIECIRLNEAELKEFCELTGHAYSKGCGYTYKDYRVAYDDSEDEDDWRKTREYCS